MNRMSWRQREDLLVKFIRTKLVFNHRFKDLKQYDSVKVYVYELDKLGLNHGPLLYGLKKKKIIDYDNEGNFKVLIPGPIEPHLLQLVKRNRVSAPMKPVHFWMREQLKAVTLPGVARKDIPVYFRAFMDEKNRDISPFFSVDTFSGRVHTPVVNLKGELRFKIRFHGSPVVSLDVKQMQPTILAKVLDERMGVNSFTDAINQGKDVYEHIQNEAGLESRDAAKKYLFQLIFGQPKSDIGEMFTGDKSWVEWINGYKSVTEYLNPHKRKTHTNLAWLLQTNEVQIMTGLWLKLMHRDIPFLTIHDEILCRPQDKEVVFELMEKELKKHFKVFKINVSKGSTSK